MGSLARGYVRNAVPDLSRGYQQLSSVLWVFAQSGDVGQISESLPMVEAIADREAVRNLESDVADRKILDQATYESGNLQLIVMSITAMVLFILIVNRFVWQPAYELAQRRFAINY